MSPPAGVHDYKFDYSRSAGKMRFKLDGESWLINSRHGEEYSSGKWEVLGTDPDTGELLVRCKLRIDEHGIATTWLPKDADVATYHIELGPAHLLENAARMCYNRAEKLWRLRDDGDPRNSPTAGQLLSNEIRDYRGVMVWTWEDGGPHIRAQSPCSVDEERVAHFALA